MKKLLGSAILTAGLLAFGPAQAQDVTNAGLVNDNSDLAGAFRARDFAGSNGEGNVYVGTPDLGVGANRTEDNFDPGGPAWGATNAVTFTYDDGADTLTVEVDTDGGGVDHTVVFNNLSTAVGGKDVDLNNLNILQLIVLDREASATTDFNNVVLTPDGEPAINLGNFAGGSSFGTGTWSVTGVDLSDGFILTGDIVLSGGPFTSNEKNKVEVQFGTTDIVLFDEQTVFLNTTGGQILSIPDSETAFPGTTCGPEPSGGDFTESAEIDIPFDSNNLNVTQDLTAPGNPSRGLCIFDEGNTNAANIDPDEMIANTIVGNGEDDYLMLLDEAVAAIGFRLITNSTAVEDITLFDESDGVIAFIDIDSLTGTNTRQFVGFLSPDIPIKKVLINTEGGESKNEGIDEIKVAEFGISKQITSGPCLEDATEDCVARLEAMTEDFMAVTGDNEFVAGVQGGGCAWTVDAASASLGPNGDFSLEFEGLLIDNPPDCGATPGTTANLDFFVSLACGGSVFKSTGNISPKPGNTEGDGSISDTDFVTPAEVTACVDPTVLVIADQATDEWVIYAPLMLVTPEIALAVEAPQSTSLHYDFKITVIPPPDAVGDLSVHDTVPAEWDVEFVDGVEVPGDNKDKKGMKAPGLACGADAEVTTSVGEVELERGGKEGKQCQSATELWWTPEPQDEITMLRVDLQSRLKNKAKGFHSPTGCGALFLNEGAKLFDDTGEIDDTGPLIVAAVEDLNGGGIDPTGNGDEDEDGVSDLDEVREQMTDPCSPDDFDNDGLIGPFDPEPLVFNDEDGDGIGDGNDPCLGDPTNSCV